MARRLRRGDTLRAFSVIRATPAQVFAVVSDPTRFPEWSPECRRVKWLDDTHFAGHNKRRLARWKTKARVDVNEPDAEFRFTIDLLGKDFTNWAYLVEPHADGAMLTEEFTMCMDLPVVVQAFERTTMQVPDRRADLQDNIDRCVATIREIVEREAAEGAAAAE
ncbi:MAG TPA: SRPBCC family protein [Gordonia sp. (in: high G+C Gram-positive bacteria)]|uniref:SRPBCC family protein n=1 Tax=unclassified Gordonia (in: high G+C Gram-positive bacteria) TaxID=2657482 RepID=UPI000F97BD31|nr:MULTISPECIES: SRPBCC family protein [unclassified Gordonia (in: high G+C Gram-positive bacteria)]RUP39485.1 MAG: SRPBCC family protein [Gordonia sp. (in: high G+C Gram-positive bacteria)]HNP55971.1 SRPBCC family protein [Gordonia sp. (in: high G+C Gram-positive bacteria)]HRC49556.1 SRPBCC family protein [Gordonia sp. (in: high G+C Gram-positive bacteria)]